MKAGNEAAPVKETFAALPEQLRAGNHPMVGMTVAVAQALKK